MLSNATANFTIFAGSTVISETLNTSVGLVDIVNLIESEITTLAITFVPGLTPSRLDIGSLWIAVQNDTCVFSTGAPARLSERYKYLLQGDLILLAFNDPAALNEPPDIHFSQHYCILYVTFICTIEYSEDPGTEQQEAHCRGFGHCPWAWSRPHTSDWPRVLLLETTTAAAAR